MHRVLRGLLPLLLTCVGGVARGGGFDYPDPGFAALSRSGAFTARADDPSALHYNPAGAARLRGTQILLSGNLMFHQVRFQRLHFGDWPGGVPAGTHPADRSPHDPSLRMPEVTNTDGPFFAPMLMVTSDWGGILSRVKMTMLAGIYGPNAHRSITLPRYCKPGVSPCEETDASGIPNPARYDLVSRKVLVLYPSVGLAWRPLKGLSIGAVFQLAYSQFQMALVVGAFDGEDPVDDVDVLLDVKSDLAPIGLFGIHYAPLRWLELGVSVRTGYTNHTTGTVETSMSPKFKEAKGFEVETNPSPAEATLDTPMPTIVRAGVRYVHHDAQERELFDVEVDFIWEDTSVLQSYDVKTEVDVLNAETGTPFIPTITGIPVPHHWKDTFGVRLGGSFRWRDLFKNGELIFRAGGLYESSAMPDNYTRLDFLSLDRVGFSLGVGLRWGRYEFGVGYIHLFHFSRTVAPDAGAAQCSSFGEPKEGCGSAIKQIVPPKPTNFSDPVGNGQYGAGIYQLSVGAKVTFGR